MNGRHVLRIFMVLCATANTIGCSCFVPWSQDFVVAGSPKDANIEIRGEGSKRSGEAYILRRNRSYYGVISRDGYEDDRFFIQPELSVWGALDVCGGCILLVPFVGLAFPGSHTLNKDYYFYNLKPIQK